MIAATRHCYSPDLVYSQQDSALCWQLCVRGD